MKLFEAIVGVIGVVQVRKRLGWYLRVDGTNGIWWVMIPMQRCMAEVGNLNLCRGFLVFIDMTRAFFGVARQRQRVL